MRRFEGSLRLPGDLGPGLGVTIDLDSEQIHIRSASGDVMGEWPRSEVGVRGEDDGFHLRLAGEEIIVTTNDDGRFALAMGLRAASPRLVRKMVSSFDH